MLPDITQLVPDISDLLLTTKAIEMMTDFDEQNLFTGQAAAMAVGVAIVKATGIEGVAGR